MADDCNVEWTCSGCPEGCAEATEAGLPLWANLLVALFLVSLSALFSGLTLGLLSLDPSGLEILADAGEAHEKSCAAKIMPLRKNGNLLLCTLLIGNVIVNSFLSILLADLTSGVVGLLASTCLIVIFGEIVPQAICSRHGLVIGSRTRFVTWFFIYLLYVVAKPISMALDYVLGKEVGTVYSRNELKTLLKMHVGQQGREGEDGITHDDHNLLAGALEYSNKRVKDVMTAVERVFMLEASTNLTFDVMLEIYKSGYTRIPVYEGSKDNILGVLYVKDLILLDPDDEIEVQTVVSFRGQGQVRFVLDTTPLNQVFKIFKASYTHLMVAVAFCDGISGERLDTDKITENAERFMFQAAQATKSVTGVITLEDILEEVIRAEIIDEYDVHVSNETMERIKKDRNRPDISSFLSLFEHKVRESTKLSRHEVHAITAFLTARVKQFMPFEGHAAQLRQLVTACTVLDIDVSSDNLSDDGSDKSNLDLLQQVPLKPVGERVGDAHTVLYHRNAPSDVFTLVLQGWTTVWAGEEAFESDLGPWCIMGQAALTDEHYRPDFAAVANGKCRLLRIERVAFRRALKAVNLLKSTGHAPGRSAAPRPVTRTPMTTADSVDHTRARLLPSSFASGDTGQSPGQQQQPARASIMSRLSHTELAEMAAGTTGIGYAHVHGPVSAPSMHGTPTASRLLDVTETEGDARSTPGGMTSQPSAGAMSTGSSRRSVPRPLHEVELTLNPHALSTTSKSEHILAHDGGVDDGGGAVSERRDGTSNISMDFESINRCTASSLSTHALETMQGLMLVDGSGQTLQVDRDGVHTLPGLPVAAGTRRHSLRRPSLRAGASNSRRSTSHHHPGCDLALVDVKQSRRGAPVFRNMTPMERAEREQLLLAGGTSEFTTPTPRSASAEQSGAISEWAHDADPLLMRNSSANETFWAQVL